MDECELGCPAMERATVYAMGVLLYELYTGHTAFRVKL